jgi:hypothetical protein
MMDDSTLLPRPERESLDAERSGQAAAGQAAEQAAEPVFVVRPPSPGAPPEAQQAFEAALLQALGAPESPDGYSLDLNRRAPIDQEVLAWFKSAACKARLSPSQVRIIAEAYAELEASATRRIRQAREQGRRQAMDQLRGVWGDEAGRNVDLALRGLRSSAQASGADLARLLQALDASGLGDNPEMVRLFHYIGQAQAEDRLVDGRPGGRRNLSAAEVLYGA